MKFLQKTALTPLAVICATGCFLSVQAAPLITISDNLNLYATGTATGAYNSNILSSSGGPGKKSDYVMTLSPGVELDYGRNTDTTLNIRYREDFLRYLQNSGLNNDLSNVFVTASRKQGAADIDANFSYVQAYTNTPTFIVPGVPVTTIIRSDVYSTGFKADYTISPKFYTDVGLQYTQTDYLYGAGAPYQNSNNYHVPANFYYDYSEKIDVGVAYYFDYTDPNNSRAPATSGVVRYDNFGGLSLRMKQWEKLTGTINLGVDDNHVTNSTGLTASDSLNLAYGVKLQYDYSEKLSFFLNGQRNFQTGAAGQNIQVTSATLSGHYAYSDNVSFDFTPFGYSYSQYMQTTPQRDDSAYNLGFAANWTPTSYLSLTAGYTYFMNSSNTFGATYNINLVTISGTVRY
jgi:hypothetical protein